VAQPQTFRSPTALVVWVVWLLFALGNWIDLAVQGRDHASAVAAALLLLATGVAYVTAQRPRIIADDAGLTIRNPLRDYRMGWAGVAEVDLVDLLRVHYDGGPGGNPGHGATRGSKPRAKVISSWAVHYSRHRRLAAEARASRAARTGRPGPGFPPGGGLPGGLPGGFPPGARGLSYGAVDPGVPPTPETSAAEAEAEKVVRLLSERATAARAEAVWSSGTTDPASSGTTDPASSGPAPPVGPAPPQAPPAGVTATTQPLISTWSPYAIAALVIPVLIVLIVWLL